MKEFIAHDEEMGEDYEDLLFPLMAGQAAASFRPRVPPVSCDCGRKLDELISLIRELRDEIREGG